MIDYVKILVKDIDIQRLINHPELEFFTEFSEKTGEIATKKIANYNFCKITCFGNNIVLFTGSIHKLWNSLHKIEAPNKSKQKLFKGYNGNQFNVVNIIEVRIHLEILFDCKGHQMIFQNIELGMNTEPFFKPQSFIKGLLFHNGKSFDIQKDYHFAQVIHQRYILKIYNKSSQYGMKTHTLRIELRIKKMHEIKSLGIKTFADINPNTLNKAVQLIKQRFDELCYYDNTISKKNLNARQKHALERYSNPRYWMHTLKPNKRDIHKKKLIDYNVQYSNNLHQKIKNEIEQKGVIINRLSEKR